MEAPSKFELAIQAAGMSRYEAKQIIGLRSYQALSERLDNPMLFRLSEIRALALQMNDSGKQILKEAVDEIFLNSDLS
jgi:hypothetical protein